jgi:glycosyltransferase involved in cell wall biosynthesis
MRVLLISHTCQSATEGQPKAHRLARIPGIELRVLVPDRWRHYGKWRAPDVPTDPPFTFQVGRVRLPWTGPAQFYLHSYPELARTLEEFKPDIIDLWEEPWALVSTQVCRLRNRLLPSTKVLCETEQNINKSLPFPFERFRSYTLRNANFVVARNAQAVQVVRSKGYAGPAEIVPNAVDAELFVPLDRTACRDRLGLTGFVVSYVGRLVEMKGLMEIVDALPMSPPDTRVVFVGSGEFQPQLECRIRELGRGSQVRFMPARPLTELPEVMNAIDVLLLVSRTTPRAVEQFGRVIIEAHACATPVIGSSSGAIPAVVGQGGLIVPERDPAALAAAITRLHDNPDEARRMGQIGRQQVEANYTWQRVAQRMADIYRRVLQTPSPQPSLL